VTPRQRSWLGWGLAGLTAALLLTALLLGLVGRTVLLLPVTLSLSVVGAVISARTGNLIGWLFVASGAAIGLSLALTAYASGPPGAARPGAGWAAWAFTVLLEAGEAMFLLIPLLFPDGRPLSPRWRPVVWLVIADGVLGMAWVALSPVNFPDNFPHLHDPATVVPASALAAAYNGKQTLEALLFAVGAAAVIVRLVRSSGEERLQLKWFTYAAAVAGLAITLAAFVLPQPLTAFAVFFPLVPVGAGIAILKYHLYGIDVVISKTIVYGCLAAFITAVYVLIVAGLGALGSGSLHPGSRPGLGLSILATAVVAVAFQPLRERLQRFANRVVYGKRATPYEALSEFAGQVGGAYATDEVLPRIARIMADATGADRADVWLRSGPQLRPGASWPSHGAPPDPVALADDDPPQAAGADCFTLVRHQGEVLGALSVAKRPGEPLTPAEDKLISDLAAQVGQVLRNAGLTGQLGERLADLRASRRRIVTAQDDQRRRIERDLATAPSGSCWPSPPGWPWPSPWPGGTRSGNEPSSPGCGPTLARPWRPCATWPAASTRRCWPTRGSCPPSLPRPGRHRCRSSSTPKGSAATRRTSRPPCISAASKPCRTRPGTRRGPRSASGCAAQPRTCRSRSPTTVPASTGPACRPAPADCSAWPTGWPRSAGRSRSMPVPAAAPPSPAGSRSPRLPGRPHRARLAGQPPVHPAQQFLHRRNQHRPDLA